MENEEIPETDRRKIEGPYGPRKGFGHISMNSDYYNYYYNRPVQYESTASECETPPPSWTQEGRNQWQATQYYQNLQYDSSKSVFTGNRKSWSIGEIIINRNTCGAARL